MTIPNSAQYADFINDNEKIFKSVFNLKIQDTLNNQEAIFDYNLDFDKEDESLSVEVLLHRDYSQLEVEFSATKPGALNDIGNPME
jgi:hypothetical protein